VAVLVVEVTVRYWVFSPISMEGSILQVKKKKSEDEEIFSQEVLNKAFDFLLFSKNVKHRSHTDMKKNQSQMLNFEIRK